MQNKIARLDPFVHSLVERAAEEGMTVTVLIKPALCVLDERTAVTESIMLAALGTAAGKVVTSEPAPGDSLEKRLQALEAHKCQCRNGSVQRGC